MEKQWTILNSKTRKGVIIFYQSQNNVSSSNRKIWCPVWRVQNHVTYLFGMLKSCDILPFKNTTTDNKTMYHIITAWTMLTQLWSAILSSRSAYPLDLVCSLAVVFSFFSCVCVCGRIACSLVGHFSWLNFEVAVFPVYHQKVPSSTHEEKLGLWYYTHEENLFSNLSELIIQWTLPDLCFNVLYQLTAQRFLHSNSQYKWHSQFRN